MPNFSQHKLNIYDNSKNLRVSFHLSSENCVVEELLESFILIVMAQVIKQCSFSLAD